MKSLIFLITLILPSLLMASNFGDVSESVKLETAEARVHTLVSNASETRRWLSNNGRFVASMTGEEEELANEYEELMADKSVKDYLQLSLELN